MEILITILILSLSIFIIYKNIRKSTKGECSCSNCSSTCPKYINKK